MIGLGKSHSSNVGRGLLKSKGKGRGKSKRYSLSSIQRRSG